MVLCKSRIRLILFYFWVQRSYAAQLAFFTGGEDSLELEL